MIGNRGREREARLPDCRRTGECKRLLVMYNKMAEEADNLYILIVRIYKN